MINNQLLRTRYEKDKLLRKNISDKDASVVTTYQDDMSDMTPSSTESIISCNVADVKYSRSSDAFNVLMNNSHSQEREIRIN